MKKNSILLSFLYFLSFSIFAQIPAGYYTTAEGKVDAALKTQLASIISAGAVDKGYDYLYTIYQSSDNLPSGKVWDMYSVKADGTASYYFTHTADKCGSYSAEGNCYNREHTFCDSWLGAASPQRSDAHHLIPTDGYVNNRRSSFPHGKVGTASWTSSNGSKLGSSDASTGYSGTVFEPIDEFKGDFARMYFYVATRYESKIAGWVGNGSAGEILAGNSYPAYKTWFYTLMVQWSAQDPISTKEINRNNSIYTIQKNRNPYIDHPELVDYIWGSKKGQAWSATGGTYPTLSTPTAGSTIDFGKIAYQQTASSNLLITAANLTGDLMITLSGANATNFTLSTTSITKIQAEAGYNLTVNYSAGTVGAQTAQIAITGGGISSTIVNLKATSSDEFLAMPATNISSTAFNANWTSSAAAIGYSLNVFTMESTGGTVSQTLLEDDFMSLSAWTTPSTGSYTTVTELTSNVRLGSSSNPGTITSGVLNMSLPTTLLVRAKQYNSDASARLTVKINSDSITSFLTSSSNQDFTVDIPAKTSTSTLTLSALGGSGKRVYVDYAKLTTQGSVQTPVVVSGYPASVGNVLTSTVSSLTPNTTYYYSVTPQGNSAAVSNQIQVTTLLVDATKPPENIHLSWVVLSDGILLRNLPAGCNLTLTNMLGKKVQQLKSVNGEIKLNLDVHGIYLLQVQKNQEIKTCKIFY